MIKTTAFFGIGTMGQPMVANLLKNGFTVKTAIHRNPDKIEALKSAGLIVCPSRTEAVDGADAVITMLPDDKEVKEVLLDPELLRAMKKDCVVIDMSSATEDAMKEIDEAYRPLGLRLIDAPVSGGSMGAKNATLAIFTSGDKELIDTEAMPVFEALGEKRKIVYAGTVGCGKVFKNLNNLMVCINCAGVAEVFALASKKNIDLEVFYNVILESTGYSNVFRSGFKAMMEGNLESGFNQAYASKDAKNALAMAHGQPMPVSFLTYNLFLMNKENNHLSQSSLCKLFM